MARPRSVQTILLDASCLIGLIKGEGDMAVLQSLLAAVDAHAVTLVESTAILAEVLPRTETDQGAVRRREVLARLESSDVRLVDVSVAVARRAADYRERYGLKAMDAIHLATAVVAGVDVLMVRDGRFPYEEDVDGVWVCKPYDIDDDKLPLSVTPE